MKEETKKDKKIQILLTIVAWSFVAVALITVLWFYFYANSHVKTNDAQVKQYITPISSQVSGLITEVKFEENQAVDKGDTLLVIDNRNLQFKIDMAEADMLSTSEQANSQNQIAESKITDIAVVLANIESAKIDVWRAQQDYLRFKNLVEQDAATLQQFEKYEAAYKQSEAKLNALERQKDVLKSVVKAEKSKIAPVSSQIAQKRANVDNAKLQYSYSYIIAPYDGWVGTKNVQVGQLVKEGQTLVQVVSKEKWVIANFKETQIEELHVGQKIEIKADAYTSLSFFGKIESFSPVSGSEFALIKPNNATGNFVKIEQRFPVKITISDLKHIDMMRSGMNVEVAAIK